MITVLYIGLLFAAIVNCTEETALDLARYKPTQQSSYGEFGMKTIWREGKSEFAVDDIFDTTKWNVTCSRTGNEMSPWWMVDLQGLYSIQDVRIIKHKGNIMNHFTIETSLYWNETSLEMIRPTVCHSQEEKLEYDVLVTLPCDRRLTAQYVRIRQNNNNPRALALCLVQVYGIDTENQVLLAIHSQRRSTSNAYKIKSVNSYLSCAAACLQEPRCSSFNMAEGSNICELASDQMDEDDVEIYDPEWKRYTLT